jgi:hypothetical protein
LKLLTVSRLEKMMESLVNACRAIGKSGLDAYTAGTLEKVLSALLKKPDSVMESTVQAIASIWPTIKSIKDHQAQSFMSLHLTRQQLMLANYLAWAWLESSCANHCQLALTKGHVNQDWLVKLTVDVQGLILSRKPRARIHSDTYWNGSQRVTYEFKTQQKYSNDTPEEQHSLVTGVILDIIREWLGYPAFDDGSYHQYLFIQHILQSFHMDVLYLAEIWDAYLNVKKYVFGNRKMKKVKKEHFIKVVEDWSAHPLSDNGSDESQYLRILGCIFKQYSHALSTKDTTWFSAHFKFDRDDISMLQLQPLLDSVASPITPNQPSSSANTIHPPEIIVQPRRSSKHKGSVDGFCNFLREALAVACEDSSTPATTGSILQQNIRKDSNRLQPLRRHGKDISRMMQSDGPYAPGIIHTHQGFFCAAIFRAITFAAPVVHSHPPIFTVDDFQILVKTLPDKQLVNMKALGTPNPNRNPKKNKIVTVYWEESDRWETWLKSRKPSFLDCITFIQATKSAGGSSAKKQSIFPQLGGLAGMLLAGDYAEAGLIPMPTITEMADIFYKINKGAKAGLTCMQLLKVDETIEECRTAFKNIYKHVDEEFTDEEKEIMGFNVIMMEHALCKYSRAFSWNLFEKLNMNR